MQDDFVFFLNEYDKIDRLFEERLIRYEELLNDLFGNISKWMLPYKETGKVVISSEPTFDTMHDRFKELELNFVNIGRVTIRPHFDLNNDDIIVHINFYKKYTGLSDLKETNKNTAKLCHYPKEGWKIERRISFDDSRDLLTEEKFKELIMRKFKEL